MLTEILKSGQPVSQEVIDRLDALDFTPDSLRECIADHDGSDNSSGDPCLFCGTYAKYNNGDLSGMWVDLTTFADYDEFITFCKAIHADEADPELMFPDFEDFPRAWYSESSFDEEAFDNIAEYVRLCGLYDQDALDAYMDWSYDNDLSQFEERYQGEWRDEEDFARSIVDDCYDLDRLMGNLASYFDYEAFARDLFMGDYYFDNGYVFRAD